MLDALDQDAYPACPATSPWIRSRSESPPLVDRISSAVDRRTVEPPGVDAALALLDALKAEGMALERRGQREEARRHYEKGLAGESLIGPIGRALLLHAIARTHMQDSNFPGAE